MPGRLLSMLSKAQGINSNRSPRHAVVSQKVCKVGPHRVHVTGCFLAVTLLLLAPIEIFFLAC